MKDKFYEYFLITNATITPLKKVGEKTYTIVCYDISISSLLSSSEVLQYLLQLIC